ncbi:MAG: hypothetical protein ACK4EY_03790 [Flavipsychrobacter sp.]|jgi:hypothetical protein|nr:hypothetical protein [Chitinophagales bacterium]
MKKQTLLLLAGGMLAFASCQNEAPAGSAGPSEAQIDSMVNARVEAMRSELMAQNDSLINALAQWKADSMIAAMKGAKPAATPKPAPKPAPKPTTPPKPAPGAVNNRPGATNTGGTKVTDRPGATNTGGNQSVSDRPGATNSNK